MCMHATKVYYCMSLKHMKSDLVSFITDKFTLPDIMNIFIWSLVKM